MPENNWDEIRRGKDAYRAKLAALPPDEKLTIIERLRDRAELIRGSASPASARQRELHANVHVIGMQDPQNVTGNIRLGVLGASSTLMAASKSITTATRKR